MKDRWITFAFAALAFIAFYRFFVGPAYRPEEEHSRPLSTEAGPNGYLALRRWFETQGIAVDELRHRYDWLERAPELPPRGNLMITTIPFKRGLRVLEQSALRSWLSDGNVVLAVAGLFDTPEWAVPDTDTFGQLRGVTGIRFDIVGKEDEAAKTEGPAEGEKAKGDVAQGKDTNEQVPAGDAGAFQLPDLARLAKPAQSVLRPIGDHALTRGVRAVHAESEYPAEVFRAHSPAAAPMLALMQDEALWSRLSQAGRDLIATRYAPEEGFRALDETLGTPVSS